MANKILISQSDGIHGISTGTSSQVLVGGTVPAFGSWITGTSASSTLGSTYTIVDTDGTFDDTGLSITLPASGTYLVGYQARTNILNTTAGPAIVLRMYNSTDAAVVTNSEQIGATSAIASGNFYSSPAVALPITVAASKVIKLQVCIVSSSGAYTLKTVNSDTNGRTTMWYVRLA